jgi:hypothetical protein
MCKSIPEKTNGNVATAYVSWDKKFYDDGDLYTYTRVINSSTGAAPRRAYGRKGTTLCFYVELSAADEVEFEKTYNAWLKAQANKTSHTYMSDPPGRPPPNCGSANDSPPC